MVLKDMLNHVKCFHTWSPSFSSPPAESINPKQPKVKGPNQMAGMAGLNMHVLNSGVVSLGPEPAGCNVEGF